MFAYTDGSVRIVVMTANLREEDWTNLTQGLERKLLLFLYL